MYNAIVMEKLCRTEKLNSNVLHFWNREDVFSLMQIHEALPAAAFQQQIVIVSVLKGPEEL